MCPREELEPGGNPLVSPTWRTLLSRVARQAIHLSPELGTYVRLFLYLVRGSPHKTSTSHPFF